MFNFLNKKPKQVSIEQQIYNDVYSAEGLILEQAKKVLDNPPSFTKEQEERLQRLQELGFKNFDEAKQLEQEKKAVQEHTQLQRIIKYYSFVYPFHRFISQDSVQVILEKYKLLLADVGDYEAEIPEKNQKEIINFRVMRKDVRTPTETRTGWGELLLPSNFDFSPVRFRSYLPDLMMLEDPKFDYKKWLEDEKQREIASKKAAAEAKKAYQREMIAGKDLQIVAPQHKLNMKNRYVEKGILRIKDPIVLQPVVLGYLIVSSWGLEAGDELVVNNINN